MFKMVRSLHDTVLTPSLHFDVPNPNVDWDTSPFAVNTELRPWPVPPSGVRRAGVERVRLRRHELPRRPRGARAGPSSPARSRLRRGVGRATRHRDGGQSGYHVLAGRRGRSDEAATAWRARARCTRRRRPARTGRGGPRRCPGWSRPGSGAPRPGRRPGCGADRGRLRGRRRPGGQAGEGRQGADRRQPCDLPDAPSAGRVRRTGTCAEGGVPVHRSGFAVRQHAREPACNRTHRRRHVPPGRRGDDATARSASVVVHLRGRRRPRRRRTTREGTAPDRGHPACGARHRLEPRASARRLRHATRHGDGTQSRGVRRFDRIRLAHVRGGARGSECSRPGDGGALDRGQWRDGGGVRSSHRDRADRRRDRWLRGHRQHQLEQPGGRRRRHRRRPRRRSTRSRRPGCRRSGSR